MHLSYPPYVPHVLPILVFLTWSSEWYLVRSTEHKAPCYVVFSTPLLPYPSRAQISSSAQLEYITLIFKITYACFTNCVKSSLNRSDYSCLSKSVLYEVNIRSWPMAVQYKASVCSCLTAGIGGSNHAEGHGFLCLLFVVCVLCVGPIILPGKSYRECESRCLMECKINHLHLQRDA
jgi:hypothetical protein